MLRKKTADIFRLVFTSDKGMEFIDLIKLHARSLNYYNSGKLI